MKKGQSNDLMRESPGSACDLSGNLLVFWGKARPLPGHGPAFHPALLHCLDVAAVSKVLIDHGWAAGAEELHPVLPFLSALHDIGKFSRGFQQQCPEHWPEVRYGTLNRVATERHDTTGFWLLQHHCLDLLEPIFPDLPRQGILALLRSVAGHHGRPPLESDPENPFPLGVDLQSARVAREVVTCLRATLGPQSVALTRRRALKVSWPMAGLINLADWIGSSTHFPYVSLTDVQDLSLYFYEHAIPRAYLAVEAAGLRPSLPSSFTGLRRLFPAIAKPSPVQVWAETVQLPQGPLMALIEDVTGSGKTEAALLLAHRLLADQRGEGIFVGLPTMATAGAMFGRLSDSYRGLFAHDALPSLALAHGRAYLDERFTSTILEPDAGLEISDGAAPASSQCAAWLADGGRKALFAQVGVGTLDQALLSVLPVRYAALRQLALSRKILIIDEVHAYDHYMQAELSALLKCHAAAGGSAILLSATLTLALRDRLMNAFSAGLEAGPIYSKTNAYPLTSLVAYDGLREQACVMREGLSRSVVVRRIENVAMAVAEISSAVKYGAAVAWIRNTVDDAIAGHEALQQAGIEAYLFHARFAMVDRLRIEAEVLGRFGKTSTNRARVVVATQVIEQSLDLDFDLIVTDMAPADLVIQRAGRLWRHGHRTDRPLRSPEILLLGPEPTDDAPESWLSATLSGTSYIYPASLVWRSARAILGAGVIATPDNIRSLVEAAYDENVALPSALIRAETESIAEGMVVRSIAEQNLLIFEKGYSALSGPWEAETRTLTRLENGPTVTLRLARIVQGEVVPFVCDATPDLAWALSEVRVAANWVADVPISPEFSIAAQKARLCWGMWERDSPDIKLVVLHSDGERFCARAVDRRGKAVRLIYGHTSGMKILPQ